jgi:hypothetical protein
MKISFSPQRREGSISVVKDGDKLRINGELFSFISLPDGATIPEGVVPCDWITGPVERISGGLQLTLVLPHGPNPSAALARPEPLIEPPDGELDIPHDPEPAEDEEPADVDG